MVIELQTSPGSINFGRKDTKFSRKQAARMAKKTPKAFYPAFGVHIHVHRLNQNGYCILISSFCLRTMVCFNLGLSPCSPFSFPR